MGMTVESLRTGIGRVLAVLEAEHGMLTELDGKIGDGDLGITLLKAFRELDRIKGDLPADLGQALMQAAAATSKVSSSSFGTLMATSFMAVAKETKGIDNAPWSNLSGYLEKAQLAMSARGKASLGDKTVLDALHAVVLSIAGHDDPAVCLVQARQAVDSALEEFRAKPNKIGRARIFAEKTIGIDDPGMVALKVMIQALSRETL